MCLSNTPLVKFSNSTFCYKCYFLSVIYICFLAIFSVNVLFASGYNVHLMFFLLRNLNSKFLRLKYSQCRSGRRMILTFFNNSFAISRLNLGSKVSTSVSRPFLYTAQYHSIMGCVVEWLRQVTELKLGRVRSNSGWDVKLGVPCLAAACTMSLNKLSVAKNVDKPTQSKLKNKSKYSKCKSTTSL